MINNSGSNNGYGDFTNMIAPVKRDQFVQGFLSGLVPYPEYEYYRIWIDYNHDNDFDDAGEMVVDLYSDFSGFVAFDFVVPTAAPLGPARMRVIMSHDNPPTPCGVYARGETEDYTVMIGDNSVIPPPVPSGLGVTNITQSSALFSWTPDNTAASYNLRYKKATETTWTIANVSTTALNVPGLSASTAYDYACQAVGTIGPSGYGATQAFTTASVILPITGVQMKAKRQGANVLVNWSTQSEQNSSLFDVERSYDGINFINIGQVQAAGNSTYVLNYQFTDINAAKGLIFYRLKLVDVDARYTYSLVSVVAKADGQMQGFLVYPNPASATVHVALPEAADRNMQLQVINQLGQQVQSSTINKGTQLITVDISKLPKGMYTIRMAGSEPAQAKQLMIL
jgi:GEVED domain/Secretion system C-terminal sorting domain/Fibronectin type III domain